jgi:hypothetical protein
VRFNQFPTGYSDSSHRSADQYTVPEDHGIARGAWKHYDSAKMAGLPTAVQVVGRRWQEESREILYYTSPEDFPVESTASAI